MHEINDTDCKLLFFICNNILFDHKKGDTDNYRIAVLARFCFPNLENWPDRKYY